MRSRPPVTAVRYVVPLAAVAAAVALRAVLEPVLLDRFSFATLFLAILVSAWYGGFGPAITATIAGGLAAAFLLAPNHGGLLIVAAPDRAGLLLYAVVGVALALLGGSMSAAWRRTEATAEELRTTLSSIGDAVIVTDELGRIKSLNPVAQALTRWDPRDAIGQPLDVVFRIVNQTTRREVESPVTQVLRSGRIVGLANHTVLIARDGCETGIDDSAAPIHDVNGVITGVVLVFRDVTDRRRAEDARRRLAAIVESSSDAIVGKDLNGTITDWNAAAERLYGYTASEIIGRPFSILVPDNHDDEVARSLSRLRHGERVANYETVRQRKNGTQFDASVSYSPILDREGVPVGAAVITRDISQRKQAEEQLRNERARFAAIIEHAPACIFAKNRDGRYLFANRALADMIGRSVDFITGRTDAELFGEELAQKFAAEDAAIFASGDANTFEEVFPWRDAQANFLTTKFPLRDADGRTYAVCGITTDITQFRQVQAALNANEERLRLALDAGHMGVWDWNIRTNDINWTDNLDSIHGLPDGTFDGTLDGFQKIIHPDDRAMVVQAIQHAIETKTAYQVEFRNIHADGTVHWMLGKGRVYSDEKGPVRMVGIAVDVTERRFSEETAHFLADASAELASLVDYDSTLQKVANLSVPFFSDWCAVDMLEADGTLRRVAVAHIDPAKIELAMHIHARFPPDPNSPRGVWNIIRTGKAELVSEITDEILAATFREPERFKAYAELGFRSYIGVPIEARGKVLGAMIFIITETGHHYTASDLAVAEDLAHRAAVAIENARLYQQVREADRRKDEFLAMLAHELRNPLAPIRTGLELLSLTSAAPQETIQLMQDQVGHLVRLVDDLLDVSRIVRGKIELRKETIALDQVVARTVEASRHTIESRDQEVQVQIPEENIWVHADRVRVAQVLENLLNNASKYTNPKGRIRVSLARRNESAEIVVEDNGIGIENDLLPHVFELFTQSSRALDRAQGGLGIGLTLVRSLVELHGGSISATSSGPDQGSRFTVTLPVARAPEANPAVLRPDASVKAPRRILVVDDNVSAARMLAMLLERLGPHQVQVAHDGPEALRLTEELHPDLVLLDIGLPGMDGYEVGRRIRSQPQLDRVLLVALTGYGQEEDRRRSKEAGFDLHLVKPVSAESLAALFEHSKLPRPD